MSQGCLSGAVGRGQGSEHGQMVWARVAGAEACQGTRKESQDCRPRSLRLTDVSLYQMLLLHKRDMNI